MLPSCVASIEYQLVSVNGGVLGHIINSVENADYNQQNCQVEKNAKYHGTDI